MRSEEVFSLYDGKMLPFSMRQDEHRLVVGLPGCVPTHAGKRKVFLDREPVPVFQNLGGSFLLSAERMVKGGTEF